MIPNIWCIFSMLKIYMVLKDPSKAACEFASGDLSGSG